MTITSSNNMADSTPVGGSRQGWYAVLCVHVSWWLIAGLIKGLGVMLPTLREQLETDTWLIGWMIAIVSGTGNMLVLLAGPLEVMFGTWTVVTTSGFMFGISIIVASFTNSVAILTLVLALIAGPALFIANVLSRAMIGRCFTNGYGTAYGIASSGHALGLVIFAPFIQVLLDTYGWRGALLLLGGLSLHLGVCGALLRSTQAAAQISGDYRPVAGSDHNDDVHGAKKKTWLDSLKDALLITRKHFGFSIVRRAAFWMTVIAYLSSVFPGNIWQIYFVAQAQAKGFSAYDAVIFTAAGGLGSIIAKIVFGLLVDRKFLKLRSALAIAIALVSLTFVTVPWMNSYWLMMGNAFSCFGAIGAVGTLFDLYTRDLLGVDLLVTAFSWIQLLTGAVVFCVGFFPGWMYDQSGSFDMAFVITGCVVALSLLALLLEWVMKRKDGDNFEEK